MGRKPNANKPSATPQTIPTDSLASGTPNEDVASKDRKVSTNKNVSIRRSGRLQGLHKSTGNQDIEPFIEHINLVESEREEEPNVEDGFLEIRAEPRHHEPNPNERSLEEKVDYLMETVEELKSKVEEHAQNENTSTDLSYKRLYFAAQKKTHALTEENRMLTEKLEAALGKVKMYDGLMEKLNAAIISSNMTKDAEGVNNPSSADGVEPSSAGAAAKSPQSQKRKRN